MSLGLPASHFFRHRTHPGVTHSPVSCRACRGTHGVTHSPVSCTGVMPSLSRHARRHLPVMLWCHAELVEARAAALTGDALVSCRACRGTRVITHSRCRALPGVMPSLSRHARRPLPVMLWCHAELVEARTLLRTPRCRSGKHQNARRERPHSPAAARREAFYGFCRPINVTRGYEPSR